jgi:hypothetical protein
METSFFDALFLLPTNSNSKSIETMKIFVKLGSLARNFISTEDGGQIRV